MFFDYPIFFEKNRVFRVYTGGKLFADFFSDDSTDGNYPEEWVVSAVHALNEGSTDEYEGISKIQGADLYLNDALKQYKNELIGEREDIGILTKILDSAIRLPVQAHPDKAFQECISSRITARRKAGLFLQQDPMRGFFTALKRA